MTKRYEIMFYVSFKKKLWPYYIFVDIFICDRLIGLLLISFDRMKFVERQCIISWLLLALKTMMLSKILKALLSENKQTDKKSVGYTGLALSLSFDRHCLLLSNVIVYTSVFPCLCLIIFIEYLKNSYNLFFEVLLVNQPIVNFVWMVYQIGWENKMWVVQMIYNMSIIKYLRLRSTIVFYTVLHELNHSKHKFPYICLDTIYI